VSAAALPDPGTRQQELSGRLEELRMPKLARIVPRWLARHQGFFAEPWARTEPEQTALIPHVAEENRQ